MPYQTIFFDLDGTLIDPKGSITKSVQYALSKFGINEELEILVPFIGPPLNKSFEKYYGFTEEQAKQAVIYYREYFSTKGIQEAIIYEGINDLLMKLKQNNKTLCIVSSKFMTFAQKLLAENKIDVYFDNIFATSDSSHADAKKEILVNEALALYPEKSKETFVMIGDREHDIIGAQANGIDSIGVLYGYGTKEEMNKIKPTHIAATIKDLEKLLVNK